MDMISLNRSMPTIKRVNVSIPAMITRIFPSGLLDDMLLIQKRFPKKNINPAMKALNKL